jgi:curved DNA-binding protein CbpA
MNNFNPLATLGLPTGASDNEIRTRYLELVKQFPPERSPDRFRQIHAAYEAANNPLIVAQELFRFPTSPPDWSDVIDDQAQRPPAMTSRFLLSLGNRQADNGENNTDDLGKTIRIDSSESEQSETTDG